MSTSPHRNLLSMAQELRNGDGDFQKCFHLYRRFHAGDKGSEILAEDFVIFTSVAEDIIALGKFLQDHPAVIVDDIYNTYSRLKGERQSPEV